MTNLSDDVEYYPKRLTITKPEGKRVFEFIVQIEDRIGAYAQLIQAFSRHNIDIRSGSVERLDPTTDSLAFLFCDISAADCTTEQLLDGIRSLPVVKKLDMADMSGKLFDRFVFPTTILGGHRVILMRVEPLLNIERRLIERFGSAGETIMYEEGKSYASEVMNEWRAALPDLKPEALLETVKDALRVTGWGVFDFRRVRDGYEVKVIDPPMLEKADYTENRFYYGVAASILENLFGSPLHLTSSTFDRENKKLVFRLLRDAPQPQES